MKYSIRSNKTIKVFNVYLFRSIQYLFLMRDKSGAIHLQHKDVVHHPYLLAFYELHHPLMAKYIDLEANASAGIHVTRLGKELNVKWLTFYFSRCLGMNVARDLLSASWVYPLPLFRKHTEVGVTLSVLRHVRK